VKRSVVMVFAAMIIAPALMAQSVVQSTLDVLPHSSDSFTLTPAAPDFQETIPIDRSARVEVIVTVLTADVSITLHGPNGVAYAFGQAAPNFDSFSSVLPGVAGSYHLVLAAPAIGAWTVEVSAQSPTAPIAGRVTAIMQSDISVALTSGKASYHVGESAPFFVAAVSGSGVVHGIDITGTVTAPDGSSSTVLWKDDGVSPDYAANDGIYTASVPLTAEGNYSLNVTVNGTVDGVAFRRTTSAGANVARRSVVINGTFVDSGVDQDGDGLIDTINVAPSLTANEAGTYSVVVELDSATGGRFMHATTVDLSPGVVSPAVSFRAQDVAANLVGDGPYTVQVVAVNRHDATDVVEVDRRAQLGTTNAYHLSDLQHPRIRITGAPQFTGVDTNGDGKFDVIQLDLDFVADLAGDYYYGANLYDAAGTISDSHPKVTLAAGANHMSLPLPATAIGPSGVNGPYELSLEIYDMWRGTSTQAHFQTPAYKASQFDGSPDVTISASTTSIDFGSATLGQSVTRTFDLSNAAGSDVQVTLSFGGSNDFTTPATTVTVPGHGNMTVSVTFTPTVPGNRGDVITVSGAGVPVNVSVAGIGTCGIVSLSPLTSTAGIFGTAFNGSFSV